MRGLAILACIVLISTFAEAQTPAGDPTCSVAALDTARYGVGPLYRDCDVDRPAKLKRAPRQKFAFPQGLRCAIVEVEFAVDDAGRPLEATSLVISTNTPELAQLVQRSLPDWRYEPALKGGVAVSQVVRARVARKDDRVPFVALQPGERPPSSAPEPPCK